LPLGQGHYGIPLHPLLDATHSILAPASRGTYLTAGMRLVGTMMLLWSEHWKDLTNGRYGMTVEEIADRTSLTPTQVRSVLDKMVKVRLVRERADGWELTVDRWTEEALRPWVAQANYRPVQSPQRT
jgi:hypothetical protein